LKTLLESAEFRAELPGWALRGLLCAATSAFWAALMGFQSPAEIAGMVAGFACWVAIFAAGCAWLRRSAHWGQTRVVAALKWGAWGKVGLTVFAWLLFAGGGALQSDDLSQIGIVVSVDMLLGLAALALVAFAAGMGGPEAVPKPDSFGLTALTTVTEGLFMAMVIAGLALLVWGGWQVWDVLQKRRLAVERRGAGGL